MADKKISQLTDGTSLQSGDFVVIARSGDNFKVDPTQFGSSIDVTGTVTADGADLDGAVVINESGADVDFRVESNSSANMLFVDASLNRVGIGTGSPETTFDVNGTVTVKSNTGGVVRIQRQDGAVFPGDTLGTIEFYTNDLTNPGVSAYIKNEATDGSVYSDLTFGTGLSGSVSEVMRIRANGNVGIGTSSPSGDLHVASTTPSIVIDDTDSDSILRLSTGSSASYIQSGQDIVTGSANPLVFSNINAANEWMRIDAAGNVGIGTSSPSEALHVVSSSRNVAIIESTDAGALNGPYLNLYRNSASPAANDYLGFLNFSGKNSTGVVVDYAFIGVQATQVTTSPAQKGDLVFLTANEASPAERMRIDSSGNVGIGTDSPTAVSGTTALEITGTFGSEVIIGTSDTTATANDLFGGVAFKSVDSNGTPPHYSGIKARAADTFGGANLEFYAGRSNYESNDPRFVIEGPQSISGEAMRINSSGNVGIGTTSPSSRLNIVQASDGLVSGFRSDSPTSNSYAALSMDGDDAFVVAGNSGGENTTLRFYTAAAGSEAEAMRIDSSGNVGIGYTSPNYKLDVYSGSSNSAVAHFSGNGSYTGRGLEIGTFAQGVADGGAYFDAPAATYGTLVFKTIGTERMRINSSGNVGIGTSSPSNSAKLDAAGSIISTAATLGSFNANNAGFDFISASKIARFFATSTDTTGGVMTFTTGQNGSYSERLRIDSSGNVGIGTSSPSAPLDTAKSASGSAVLIHNLSNPNNGVSGTSAQLGLCGISGLATVRGVLLGGVVTDTGNAHAFTISTSGTAAVPTERMRIDGSGRVGIGTNSPSQALDVVGNIEVSGGVYLGGTVAANLLDDYEEGTFTPVLTGSTSGTLNGTGVYTKVGNKVTIFITFTVTTGTKPTGDYSITGLPFTSKTTSPDATSFTVAAVRVTFDSAKRVVAAVAQNSSVISMAEETSNALGSAITDANFVNGSNMFFRLNGTYLVD